MPFSFLKPSRCVLLIGDDALSIYNVMASAVRFVASIPWGQEDFENVVIHHIRRDCGGKPVLIINDMTDQHFKGGQRLPRVGPLDRPGVLARKLQVAFPNYPIRGALPLKEGVPGRQRHSGLYLFAAVPMSEAVAKTTEAATRSMATISGFCLLPVESSDLVVNLASKLAGRGRKPGRWIVFLGQHNGGALRQVITRDGQLAMTRMTPIIDTDDNPEAWAQEVNQELKATVSYLSRFGFTPQDGVDVIVISSQKSGEILEQLIDIPCSYTSLSANEAARALGSNIGVQSSSRYADVLNVAWAGRKARFILPMKAGDLDKVNKPRQVVAAASLLFMLTGSFLAWQTFSAVKESLSFGKELQNQRNLFTKVDADYQAEVQRMQALGLDIKLIQGMLATYDDLEGKRIKTLDVIGKIDKALGDDLILDTLEVSYADKPSPSALAMVGFEEPQEQDLALQARLGLSFPSTIEPGYGVQAVLSLKKRLEGIFEGYTITIDKNVAGLEYSDAVSGTAGQTQNEQQNNEYRAELTIKGALK